MQIGLITEEVTYIFIELIAHDENNLPDTLRYMEFISLLLHKVKQLENKINLS